MVDDSPREDNRAPRGQSGNSPRTAHPTGECFLRLFERNIFAHTNAASEGCTDGNAGAVRRQVGASDLYVFRVAGFTPRDSSTFDVIGWLAAAAFE